MENYTVEKMIYKAFSETCRRVALFTINGYQMRGVITQVGPGWLVIRCGNNDSLVMLSAVSTIAPE